jgi:hypothetical protein
MFSAPCYKKVFRIYKLFASRYEKPYRKYKEIGLLNLMLKGFKKYS